MNSPRSADLAATLLRVALGILYLAHSRRRYLFSRCRVRRIFLNHWDSQVGWVT